MRKETSAKGKFQMQHSNAYRLSLVIAVVLAFFVNFCPIATAKKPVHAAATKKVETKQPINLEGSTSNADEDTAESQSENADANETVVEGATGTSNLANLEALLNIIANSLEICGICLAGSLLWVGLFLVIFKAGKRKTGAIILVTVPFIALAGLAVPGIINWLVASARDANLFS